MKRAGYIPVVQKAVKHEELCLEEFAVFWSKLYYFSTKCFYSTERNILSYQVISSKGDYNIFQF